MRHQDIHNSGAAKSQEKRRQILQPTDRVSAVFSTY